MRLLVRITAFLKRVFKASVFFLLLAGIYALVLTDTLPTTFKSLSFPHFAILLIVILQFCHKFYLRVHDKTKDSKSGYIKLGPVQFKKIRFALLDFKIALLFLLSAHLTIFFTGGPTSVWYPLLFLLLAATPIVSSLQVGLVLSLTTIALETLFVFLNHHNELWQGDLLQGEPWQNEKWYTFGAHVFFMLLSTALGQGFSKLEIEKIRRQSQKDLDEEKDRIKSDSRIFRLVAAPSQSGKQNEEKLISSSVEEVHHQIFHMMKILQQTLGLNSSVLMFLDEKRENLKIVELVTESENISEGPFHIGQGVIGAVIKRQLPMKLEHIKPNYSGICYYREGCGAQSFLGVPIFENGELRGVLCVDRTEDVPFEKKEERILEDVIQQVLRIMENERLFVQLEKTKHEQTTLHRASQALGAALDEKDVIREGLSAAMEISPYDFAAFTSYNEETKKHTVLEVVGEDSEKLTGLTFRNNASLVSMVVKNKHYLPYKGEFDDKHQFLFLKRTKLKEMDSVLVVPLVVQEKALGTLVLAARRKNVFTDSIRSVLQVLSNQIAVSFSNAISVKRLEELATIDGLTGCLNKRTFLEELNLKLESAKRFDRPLSLIVTDLDHFKTVNDTYGHAVGDEVIKMLGDILNDIKRTTDTVARFGGEEFCVLCEETESKGALMLAERVREAIEARNIETEFGKFSITCSLGVATFPLDAQSDTDLFVAADKALYVAKESGRNQVQPYSKSAA